VTTAAGAEEAEVVGITGYEVVLHVVRYGPGSIVSRIHSPDDSAAGGAVGDGSSARGDGDLLSGVDGGLAGGNSAGAGQKGGGKDGETHFDRRG
jgi:hypothetical protein